MKKMLLIGAMLLSGTAAAETVLFEPADGRRYVGDEFNAREAKQVLYQDRPCQLPIVNAKDMHEYASPITHPSKACWGRLLGGDVVVVFDDGYTLKMPESAFVTATVDKTGQARVTKSVYKRP
ncbi:hypothetical protein N7414_00980 [Pseudomonas sp. GD04087]|uniref:hypothetical protein n=1 Tax=unclassified Pseudomonas TaxID=196821 RepID=UPI002449EC88|nr:MULTISPECIES: hypothetical protein [unclassified Pseudomonas]MDH0287671.1 hypothetical protein [Pseudomonas sp. GD04087]MDH1050904.1 hypothetical protein [Pseudomonas sp. GD03903]MDH1999877.1 hypothetical protein [Pseudomonas sp. GD03691]